VVFVRPVRVIALAIGCLLVLPALALLLGGAVIGVGYAFGRDDDGYFQTTIERIETATVAVSAEDLDFATDPGTPGWVIDLLDADVRLRVESSASGRDMFIGIGPEADVDAYLAGVAHNEIFDLRDRTPVYRNIEGDDGIAAPTAQGFWTEASSGPLPLELEWEAVSGTWSAVLMNADGSPGVTADVNVGVKAGFILPTALIMLASGAVLTPLAIGLIIAGASGRQAAVPGAPGAADAVAAPLKGAPVVDVQHPVAVTATLDPELSQWKWLVKWFLAIPHVIVLFFLWIAFAILTVVAFFAILFTGRYPRGLFDFNVGVLRWSWRVSYYAASGGLGSDRYPPFSLDRRPGDLATLDIAYPEQLSRGLVLIKWWLLAIPHYIFVGLVTGSAQWTTDDGASVSGISLLALLTFVAVVVLLFTGRYPRSLFDLIIGLNRWIYRVVAYAALMTDVYPPFRLDQGGSEPITAEPEGSDGAPPDLTPVR
jgi:hypothetical protein